MKLSTRAAIAAALVVATGLAGAENTVPIADVSLRFNPAVVSLPDIADETAIHALLDVTNQQDLSIVLVSVRATEGSDFAVIQEPAPGWTTKSTRTTIEFAGALAGGDSASLPLRIVDTPSARSGQFEISIHTVEADGTLSVTRPLAPLEQDVGDYTCQLVFMAFVDDTTSFLPVSSVGDTIASSAYLLAAVYDPEYRSYVGADLVGGKVNVTSKGFVSAITEMPLDLSVDAPFINTAAGPTLTLPGTYAKVRATQLWAEEGARRDWFASHPGVFLVTAHVTVGGQEACAVTYNYATSISPDAAAAAREACLGAGTSLLPHEAAAAARDVACLGAGTPLVLVPPELDWDNDGFSNVGELRGNSNPLWAVSTPYTDDDIDGTENGRDLFTVPLPR